ncbi:uncharacterized protein LOC112637814 [Camponotus floridanus]|uniref:uncharacterized protein LOC112637814 n=1 Tax=Camponotus floridanus TaxID=104421 RepID=UPI000DC67575|nr:uncharacterized protein LOC112637814 [Camponotus floridanus]
MLIGVELFWKLICAGQIKSSRTQPILQKTLLGWIISGPTPSNISSSSSSASNCLAVTTDLNRALSRFWEIDHLGSSTSVTPEEQACERLFQDTVRRNNEGRFIVQLPIKVDKLVNLEDSQEIATKRFKALENRLKKSPKLHVEYKLFIQEYLQLGHMREVTSHLKSTHKNYYLPHHAVYKETSTTTKLRVVLMVPANLQAEFH